MRKSIFILALILFSITDGSAQTSWTFELLGGEVYNVPMPLIIRQDGYPKIQLSARYHTEPFTLPVYWDLRFSRRHNNKSWEFEAIHHKLYLQNTTPEVQKFNISHGFNLFMVNRGFEQKTVQYRAGAGIVLSHPESNIRGQEDGDSVDDLDLGYSVSGPVLNLAIGKSFQLTKRFFMTTEAKTTFAYSSVKIGQGHADVYCLTFHLLLGLGVDLFQSGEE
jgi:hypothetical protein